jgi:diguanylate cyclase (GGDEF)-like protein
MILPIIFAIVCAALGTSAGYVAGLYKFGWWMEEATDDEQTKQSLQKLQKLTKEVSGQVEAHTKRVESAQRDLEQAQQNHPEDAVPVTQAAEALRAANEELQAELRKAKRELERQASELQSHRREARTDALTQLLNRRAFDEEMKGLPQRIALTGSDSALLLFDIDHFKKFNDTYGHQTGDRVLKHVADVVRKSLTGLDVIAARYGGEEFAIILASGTLMAARVAEDVRTAVEQATLRHEGQTLAITISIGLSLTNTGKDPEQLIALADEALYSAKRGGRNCSYYHDGQRCVAVADLLAAAKTAAAAKQAAATAVPPADPIAERVVKSPEAAPEEPELTDLNASLRHAEKEALAPRKASPKDRRKHIRKPYDRSHLIGPIVGGHLPTPESFVAVQFFDISAGGFGMWLASPPTFKNFVVALEKIDGNVYALAEVVRVRRDERTDQNGQRLWQVGCRFTGKLQTPQAEEAFSTAGA